jgi:glycosyltransferase involved in cell wall biosynthesis
MAVENAKGAFIAFIDDDEFPEYSWLINLFKTYQRYKCTGVLGPVKPYFEEAPPEWLVKGNFCVRDSFKTGHVLHPKNTRTGNVLLSSTIFDERSNRFILEFGRTGGEDVQFFLKSIGEGHIFVWCEEAIVYEHIPPERQKKSFYLRKDLRMGGLTGEMHRSVFHSRSKYLAKVSAAFFLYLALLPFSFLFGQHNYMKCLTKSLYFLGCISGFLGYVPIRYR